MNFLTKSKIILIELGILFVLFVFSAQAQVLETEININMKPEFPRANQTIMLNLESYSTDLNKADIYWYENDVLQKSGLGEKDFSFKVGEVGKAEKISVKIITNNFGVINKQLTINPSEVDLIWEADSITPPFYKGKALNSYQSDVKVVAMPNFITENGKKINSKNLVYKWRKDWRVLGNLSGVGKNVLKIKGLKEFKENTIVVDIESLDGSLRARRTIVIKPHNPKVIFYKKDSLLGTIFNRAISDQFDMKEEEVAVVAYPFFFSKEDSFLNKLEYDWAMNNKKINNKENIILLRKEENTKEGISSLDLKIKNTNRIMQLAENKFNVIFGAERNSVFEK